MKRSLKIFYSVLIVVVLWAALFGFSYLAHIIPETEWWSFPLMLPVVFFEGAAVGVGIFTIVSLWELP